MKTKSIKKIDKFFGSILCSILGIFKGNSRINTPKKILIVRLWAIGESILVLPMISSLRKKFPKAKIDVLVNNKPYKDVFYGNKNINNLVYWSPFALLKIFKKYDVAIDTEPYLNVSAISSFLVAKKTIGFGKGIRSFVYNKKIYYDDMKHVTLVYMDMLKPLGIEESPKSLIYLNYPQSAEKYAEKVLKNEKIGKKELIIGFFAGASENARSRIWPAERFAELGKILSEKHKAKVILFGLESEKEINKRIMEYMDNKAINLTGKTSLLETIALIKKCSIFISNDSGPMHIAAAQGVRTIGLFGPNLPERFGPYGSGNVGIRKETMKPCINVHLGEIPECNHDHMSKISVKEVLKAAEVMINEGKNKKTA